MNDKIYNEYSSLREELLILANRSHDLWRWGIISIFAIFSAVLFFLLEIIKGLESQLTLISLIKTNIYLIVSILNIFPSSVALFIAILISDIKNTSTRLGAYLAIFHDDFTYHCPNSKLYGWHVWNRIEKFYHNNSQNECKAEKKPKIYIENRYSIYIILLLFYSFGNSVLLSIINAIKINKRVNIESVNSLEILTFFSIGIVICLIAWLFLIRFENKNLKSVKAWNERWIVLRNLDVKKLNTILTEAGLKGLKIKNE